jgi:hypothetical protein
LFNHSSNHITCIYQLIYSFTQRDPSSFFFIVPHFAARARVALRCDVLIAPPCFTVCVHARCSVRWLVVSEAWRVVCQHIYCFDTSVTQPCHSGVSAPSLLSLSFTRRIDFSCPCKYV